MHVLEWITFILNDLKSTIIIKIMVNGNRWQVLINVGISKKNIGAFSNEKEASIVLLFLLGEKMQKDGKLTSHIIKLIHKDDRWMILLA